MSKERRNHKFINRWAQIRIAGEVVLHSLLLVALIAWILFAPPFAATLSNYSIEDHQAVARDLLVLNAGKWPLFVLLALFVGLVSVLFSHHIVGPAFQLGKVVGALRDRNLTATVKFRKWDYLLEIEDGLNRAIARFRDDVRMMASEQEKACALFRETKGQIGSPEKATELEKHLTAVEGILKSYQI